MGVGMRGVGLLFVVCTSWGSDEVVVAEIGKVWLRKKGPCVMHELPAHFTPHERSFALNVDTLEK